MPLQRQKLAIFVHGQFGMADVITAMGIGHKSLVAVGGPFDVAVELFGGPSQANVFGIKVDFGAETTAHIGSDDTHLVFGQTHHECRHEQTLDVRVLVGDIQGVLVRGTASWWTLALPALASATSTTAGSTWY